MTRSIWKGPFCDTSIIKSIKTTKKLWSRRSVIHPSLSGSFIEIYNGKSFLRIKITESMIGRKFGAFVNTRKVIRKK